MNFTMNGCEKHLSDGVRVYFLSSGLIGVPILEALLREPRVILTGIGSQPDRPVGRKQVLTPTAFARHALSLGCEVDRVESVNCPEFLEKIRVSGTEIVLVVSFGQLLKRQLLELPPFGCLNIHASLLPKYRGACPINAAILNGDGETGVSFMQMGPGLDTGPVYCTRSLEILPNDTTGSLEARLGHLAAESVADVLWSIARLGATSTPQPEATMPNVRKISKNDGVIDWSEDATRIACKVRAYLPWPKTFTYLPVLGQRRRVQVTNATVESDTFPAHERPGEILSADGKGLRIACGQGVLCLHRVIPEGKKEMAVADFLRGNPVVAGAFCCD